MLIINKPRLVSRVIPLLLAAILIPSAAFSFQGSAGITGTIKDPSGALVEGATITLKNLGTDVSRSSVTNAAGDYRFVDVLPARYSMVVSKTGFSTVSQSEFTISVNQTATYDFTLTVGSTQQTITIEESAVAIQSATAELGTVINQQAVNDLPLNGRNFTQLLTLTPGASPVSVGQNSGGGGGFAGNAIGSFSFPAMNGQRNRSNMFLLDGVVNLGSFIGNYNFSPIVDSVQEFKVQTHNDEAEFGQAAGGVINVVTKAGTNTFHGSLWNFLRNDDLDSNNGISHSSAALRQNQFGVAGGGPVWIPKVYNGKNRTFFYGAYEGYRQRQATNSTLLTATPAQLTGDFSGISSKIYDPTTIQQTGVDAKGVPIYTAQPFANNKIPANRLNGLSELYATTLFPAASNIGVPGKNVLDTTPRKTNQDSFQGRVDQTFGQHDVLFGRISEYTQGVTASGGFPGAVTSYDLVGWNWGFHDTHTFSPTMVLDVRFGRNWGDDLSLSSFPSKPGLAAQLISSGFSPNFINNFQGGKGPFVPSLGVSNYLSAGSSYQDTRLADNWSFGGDFTKIMGRHTFKAGASFSTNNTISPIYSVSESFAAVQTQNPASPGGTGDAMASFLLGIPDSASRRNVLETEHGGWVNGFYIQDQFKVNSKLTLNFGLRWDVTLWPIYGQPPAPDAYVGDLNLNNGTYVLANVPGACSATQGFPCIPGGTLPANVVKTPNSNGSIYKNDKSNWQGRFGFGYRLSDKTAIRGGYARFYDNWNSIIQLAQNYEGTWPDVGQLIANNLNHAGGAQTGTIGDPFNLGSGGVVYPAATPFLSSGFVNWYVDPGNYKMPYSDQWNFGVEQQVGSNTVLSVAYVGAHSLRLNLGSYGNTAMVPGGPKPYSYITPTYYDRSIGQSKYNAFQFRLQQRATKGLMYLISYTRSKSMDVACSGSFGAEGCNVQFPWDLNKDRSVSGFDLPNVFSASFSYDLPIGKGKMLTTNKRALDYVIGNWQIAGLLSLHSGQPFTVGVSNGNLSNTGNVVERANQLLANPYSSGGDPRYQLNPAAFGVPAPNTYGSLGRNSLRIPSYRNLDLSLIRRFPIKERLNVEFRAEAFNLTNTINYGQPQSTVDNSNFGVITGYATGSNPRQMQFALKVIF